MTLAGTVLLNENLLAQLRLTPAQIKAEKKRVGLELEKRNKMLRAERPFPDLNAKRVILVDDGLAPERAGELTDVRAGLKRAIAELSPSS